MPELSIVMPCYLKNDELLQLTKNALHSLRESDLPSHEIILVDDGSPIYRGFLRDKADTYIMHQKNKGFIKSVNDGMRVARGENILVCNNDTRAAPNFYEVAKEILDSDEKVYSVHPRMCFYYEPIMYGDRTHVSGKERWCQSSFFIIRNEGSMFPEHFEGTGGAYEDWFFWSNIRALGLKTAYTTKTCFQHKDSSTTQVIGEGSKFHTENRQLFIDEFGSPPEEYYTDLYPEQMSVPWREEFQKL